MLTQAQEYLLPPRRARLPEDVETPQPGAVLHSPFSPLSPSCALYPDGIIDAQWLWKHQELVPAAFLSFYSLTSDSTLATLHDNKIKTDINTLKSSILQSGYKSRLSVVILPDEGAAFIDGAQERMENIRRGCGLDTKSFFFLPSHGTKEELERTADNMLATLYTQAIEQYRDLGRHSRRKRGRGTIPQPTVPPTSGTSQTLSLSGWTVRYDFKSGIFAEFRQEMDIALRSFEQAYETLLGADVLDSIPSWSPRWNEARMLADILAVRTLRCLLWNGQHSSAVRRWQSHRDRMCDLIDTRGRGTNNYGWKAWEARWAITMANLMERAVIPGLAPELGVLFLQPEKGVIGERLPPWELLHHTGYWYRSAARHLYARRALAYDIPEEDRRPPDFSPASKVANRAFTYDTYMCPEPHEEYPIQGREGVDHSKLIIACLSAARSEFQRHKQPRFAQEIALECAKEFAGARRWKEAFDLLLPLWDDTAARLGGWLQIVEDVGWILRAAAAHLGRGDVILGIDWELLSQKYTRRQGWRYDIARALEGVQTGDKPDVELATDSAPSFLSTSFVFAGGEGKAGQNCQAQLALTSTAFPGSAPVKLEKIVVKFEGSIRPVVLHPSEQAAGPNPKPSRTSWSAVALHDETEEEDPAAPGLSGSADLTIHPGTTKILEMAIHLREPGDARASSADLHMVCDAFTLRQSVSLSSTTARGDWFLPSGAKKRIPRADASSIHILPRPPKLEIQLLNLLDQYYTNEPLEIEFRILNAEDSEANIKLDVVMFGEEPRGFKLLVNKEEIDTAAPHSEESSLLSVPLGGIGSSKSIGGTLQLDGVLFSTSYEFTLRAAYYLVSDPVTPITQATSFKTTLVNPFEANYDLLPQLHPDPWPSLFDYEGALGFASDEGGAVRPHGLSQSWSLVARYASFASEDLRITGLDIAVQPIHGLSCSTRRKSALPDEGLQMKPKTIEEAQFGLNLQKTSLDHRDPATLDVSFLIQWQRLNTTTSPTTNTTPLAVPRLSIFGSEPRVLASVSYPNDRHGLIFLTITIENASNHFLTFGLSMEPSDEFAFSGAKQTTINLLPISRRSLSYRLLPLTRGAWIKPGLLVRDKYFQKVLRIIPTEGMKADKDGFLIWVPPEDDEPDSGE